MGSGVRLGWLLCAIGVGVLSSNLVDAQPSTLPSLKSGEESSSPAAQTDGPSSPAVVEAAKQLEQIRRQYNEAVKSEASRPETSQRVERLKYDLNLAELRLRQAELSEADLPETHKLVLNRDLDTALAETRVQFATTVYETAKKLYSRGSNSQQDVKRALYELSISQIELRRAKINAADLADAEKTRQLADLQIDLAKLDYDKALATYELTKRLYQKSSVSKQRLLYSHFQARIARLNLAAAQVVASKKSDIEKRFQLIDLVLEKARAKNNFLKTVHEANQALFEKGRISKQEFLRSQQALEKSELELEAAKAAAVSNVET